MKRYYILSISALLMMYAPAAFAAPGEDLMKARYLYTHLAFNEAIPYYEKVAANENSSEIYTQLGDCYRLIKKPEQAAVYYAKAVAINGVQPLTRLQYAKVLMSLQRYADAVVQLRLYQQQFPSDRRADNMIKGAEHAEAQYAAIPGGTAKLLSLNTNGNEFGPALRNNELIITADTIIAGSGKTDKWTGEPFYNLYAVKCDNDGNCQPEFRKVGTNLNSKFHDGPLTFSSDGRDAYFTRTNFVHRFLVDNARKDEADVVHLQIMVASGYDSSKGSFQSIKPFPYNNKSYSTAHPSISPSGNTLVFCSDMPGTEGGTDLYVSRRSGDGTWSVPANLGKHINTEGEEMFPYLHDDNTLYFASDGWPGLGGLDLFKVSLEGSDAPEHLDIPLNSSADDMSLTLLSDGSTGYFASNRAAAKSGDNVYRYTKQELHLALMITDEYSGKPVSGCTVNLESVPDKRSMTTGSDGALTTRIYPMANYMVKLSRPGYQPQTISFSALSNRPADTIRKSVSLRPNTQITYNAVIMDRATKLPIEDPVVVITRIGSTQKPDSVLVPGSGRFIGSLERNSEYQVYAVKPDYYSEEKYISTKGIIPGSNDQLRDTIFMKKLEIGAIIRIENIYYDYDKANIREDAKPSLNRLLDLMTQSQGMHIQINAHTDCRGSDTYNRKLSDARATSVVRYLTEKGIDAGRLQSRGFGESSPVEPCDCSRCSEAQYQQNRRTEFQILKM